MGMIDSIFGTIFGQGGKAIRETIEVFRENADEGAERDIRRAEAALEQFAAEFARRRKGRFDRFMDGVNRVPRPAMALGTLGLFAAAMIDPTWFAARMRGIQLVPEPLWWLLGAIVSFYFGARHQAKGQDFRRSLAETMVAARQVQSPTDQAAAAPPDADQNPALRDWKVRHDG